MKRQRLPYIFIVGALMIFYNYALSYAFTVPDTGQTTCYDANGNVIACAGTGQDGAYIINPMSYTDNGDGTVTDNVTGLMWQKQDDGNWRAWSDAGTYCSSLGAGLHSDWRLPGIKELMSIVNYGIPYPAPTINSTYFPNTNASFYWSSTTDASGTYNAWSVFFYDGLVIHYVNSSFLPYVRCVRGGQQSQPRFTDNRNGTVTDSSTGLMWQQAEGGLMPWTEALSYCTGLNLGGNSDWRLPNIKELALIADYTTYNPAINTTFFPNANASIYWSSTPGVNSPSSPWVADFYHGDVGSEDESGYYYVRCVRGGQSGPAVNYTLSVTTAGTGSGNITVNSGMLSWSGSTGTAFYSSGTSVTLTATPASGLTFTSWSGCDNSSGNTCTVSMTTSRSVTATFGSCTYQINPTSQSFNSSGGSGSVSVTTSAGCPWTSSNALSWLTITSGSSGTGSGAVSYSVPANTGTSSQTGNITIAGQTFGVTQAAAPTTSGNTITVGTAGTYLTIQGAYNSAGSGDTIQIPSGTMLENVNLNINISVALKGGYNSSFTTNSSNSAINGILTISNGTATVQNITIQ